MKPPILSDMNLPAWVKSAESSSMQDLLSCASNPEFISFALGLPDTTFFPKFLYQEVVNELIKSDLFLFQYAPPLEQLKSHIVSLMAYRGVVCNEKQIFLTSGAQQGLSLLTRLLLEPTREVILEGLAYPGILQAIEPYSPRILTVTTDLKTGINVDEVETILKSSVKPALIYVICDGNNPYGINLEEEKRIKLAKLAAYYKVPIIEDDPYGFLSYEKMLPPLKHYGGDWVFYVGSFSKIFAPSLRVGWIIVPEEIVPKLAILKESSDINIATFTQRTVNSLLNLNIFEQHVKKLRQEYIKRRDCLVDAIKRYFPIKVEYYVPENGIFLWVELPKEVNTTHLLKISIDTAKVVYVPSEAFCVNKTNPKTNGMRLNFSNICSEKIVEGIKRLGSLIQNNI